jgi:hypothetical protein
MKLSQKIKHIKRHRKNKRFAKLADDVHFAASDSILNGNGDMFIISPRLYHVINVRKGHVPKNIKNTNFVSDTCIITVPTDIIEFYNDNKFDYIKGWVDTTLNCPNGMPYTYTDIKPDYLNEIGLRPSVLAAVPNSVTVKEV